MKFEDGAELNEDTSLNIFSREEGSVSLCDIHSAEEEKQPTIEEDQTKSLNDKSATGATGTTAMETAASTKEQSSRIKDINLGKDVVPNIVSNIANAVRNVTFQDLENDLAQGLGGRKQLTVL